MADSYDFIAIGGGYAGLCGAARAAELGQKVAVLERAEGPGYACNSRVSGGVIHVAQHDAKKPEAELQAIADAAVGGVSDPELLKTLVEDTRRAIDWLRACGAMFVRGYNRNWVTAPPRPAVTNLVWEKLGNDRTLGALVRTIEKHGGEILYGHRALELIPRDGGIGGVIAERAGTSVELHARAVLVADGGFHANPDMIREHIGPNPDRIVARNAGLATGDGLRMAVAAGAATSPLDVFYGHLLSADAFGNHMLWPYPQLDLVAFSSIMVDRNGDRVLDEGLGGIHAANMLARSPDPVSTLIVCDADCWAKAGTEALIPPNPLLAKHGGRLYSADTLDALAAAAGIDASGLARTVASYNAAVSAGSGAELDPPRSFDKRAPMPVAKAPFYAIPCAPGLTNTMGGLLTDRDGRVLSVDGGPIAGLFAAGAATGGIEGGPKLGYVGGLCRAVLFGMRAGEAAAAR